MKGISHNATIGSIRAKVDRSASYTLTTPELSSEDKVLLMDLQNQVLDVTLRPLEDPEAVIVPVKETLNRKSQAERLRSVIFALWSAKKEHRQPVPDDFQDYYHTITEWLIDKVKSQIEEVEQ